MEERLKQYIENINQLGADARYEDNYDRLRTKLESIITWCNMSFVIINRLERKEDK